MYGATMSRFMQCALTMRMIASQQRSLSLKKVKSQFNTNSVCAIRTLTTAPPTRQTTAHNSAESPPPASPPVQDVISTDNTNPFQMKDQREMVSTNDTAASHPPGQSHSPGQSHTQPQSQTSATDASADPLYDPTTVHHDTASVATETVSGLSLPDGPITVFGRFIERLIRPGKDVASSASEVAANNTEAAVAATDKTTSFSDLLLTPAMSVLNGVHDITGLPWWLSIPIATVTIRTLLLPVTITTMKNSAIMAALKDDIAHRREAVMEAARSGDRLLAGQRQNEMQSFMRNAGVAPMRVLIGPLVQFPVFISFFVSIRRLATADPAMATEGLAWFSDLSVQDPYYVLPVICGATLMAMTELGGDTGSAAMTPQMKLAMRIISVISVPLTYWFPSAVFCYWIPNNIFSLSLGAIMRSPSAKKSLGLTVNPANIPGTRAAQLKAAQLMSGGRRTIPGYNFDPATAVASYSRRRSTIPPSTETVKPVLLKSRPKKAKAGT